MNAWNKQHAGRTVLGLAGIRARTWLILGAIVLAILALLAWAAIALLSWLWAQAPAATETGRQLAGEATTRLEQAAPGLQEQVDRWLPGVREQVDQWLPGLGEEPPAHDVSGADLGPVARFPGLVRSHYASDGQAAEVRYTGRADFAAVLAHYVQGYTGAGFAHEVRAATPDEERHHFRRGQESIGLVLVRRPGGLVEIRLQQPAS